VTPARLVLFDIDGTLLSGGPAKEAFRAALEEVFGTTGPIEEWEFSGKTDPQIARELMTEAGLGRERIEAGFPALWRSYLGGMEARLGACPTVRLPGVLELLPLLRDRGVALGLLTGNVVEGARLKLGSAGLGEWFAVGAFGSDQEERNDLPPVALERAREHWGTGFAPTAAVVVGDTPRDVECGRRHGIRTVAVATGRFGAEVLEASGADRVLPDLSATALALEAILD